MPAWLQFGWQQDSQTYSWQESENQLQDFRDSQVTAVDALKYGPYKGQPSEQENQAKDKRCGNWEFSWPKSKIIVSSI